MIDFAFSFFTILATVVWGFGELVEIANGLVLDCCILGF
jgi:Na+-transporting methylmalonyl-CoA/oxaloacetate decarboxylase gamma subunit